MRSSTVAVLPKRLCDTRPDSDTAGTSPETRTSTGRRFQQRGVHRRGTVERSCRRHRCASGRRNHVGMRTRTVAVLPKRACDTRPDSDTAGPSPASGTGTWRWFWRHGVHRRGTVEHSCRRHRCAGACGDHIGMRSSTVAVLPKRLCDTRPDSNTASPSPQPIEPATSAHLLSPAGPAGPLHEQCQGQPATSASLGHLVVHVSGVMGFESSHGD